MSARIPMSTFAHDVVVLHAHTRRGSLSQIALAAPAVSRVRPQHFQGHHAARPRQGAGSIHDAHAAAPDFSLDLIGSLIAEHRG